LITIDIDAADFVDAADHQKRIESLMDHLRNSYPAVELVFRERRQARGVGPSAERRGRARTAQPTGKLKTYVD